MKEKQSKCSVKYISFFPDYIIDPFVKNITNYIYEVIHPFYLLKD